MALVKVNSPLFSEHASGNIKRQIIFTTINRVPVVKRYNKATDSYTVEQQIERGIFLQGANAWKDLSPEEKAEYESRVNGRSLTGYNIYMSDFIKKERKKLKYGYYGFGKYGVQKYA